LESDSFSRPLEPRSLNRFSPELLRAAIPGVFLTLTFAVLAQQLSRNHPTVTALALLWATHILYLVAAFHILKLSNAEHRLLLYPHWGILVALAMRLLVAPVPPVFSDDLYRYRWEGLAQVSGLNPYTVSPATALERDPTFDRIPANEFPAGYGPLTLLAEHAGFRLARTLSGDPWEQGRWMKVAAWLADLAMIPLLIWATGRPEAAILYGWHPLVVFEFWGMGHNDPLALLGVVAALGFVRRGRWGCAAAALGFGVAAKWWPLMLLPLLFARAGWRQWWKAAWVALPVAIFLLPFWTNLEGNARFMTGFASGWRNNDSLYCLVLALTGSGEAAKPWVFGGMALTAAVLFVRRVEPARASAVLVAATLLLAANVHPWYLTWFVPLLVWMPASPVMLWLALSPIAYAPVFLWEAAGIWQGNPETRWLAYGPVFAYGCWWIIRRPDKRTGRETAAPSEP
jgi:hypothetical protein